MDSYIDLNTIPDGITASKDGEALEISISWRDGFWSAAIFAGIVTASSIYGIFNMARSGAILSHLDGLVFVLVINAAVWALAYVAHVNKTCIRVTPTQIRVTSRPMPWIDDRVVDSPTLRQLFVAELRDRRNRSTQIKYEVRAVRTNGENVPVVTGLNDIGLALWVQSRLDDHLGLKRD